jgi:hypothetical protein
MPARSQRQPSLRRSSRRGDQSFTSPSQVETNSIGSLSISNRPRRNRISFVADAENLRKRRKVEQPDSPTQFKFPLRRRPDHDPLQTIISPQNGAKPMQKQERCYGSQIEEEKHQLQQAPKSSRNHDQRSLRSRAGGSRSKSELSLYFSNYEQMLSLEPIEPGERTTK